VSHVEHIIHGDLLEFVPERSFIIFDTGARSSPEDVVHQITSDGERITLFVDHSLGSVFESYVVMRVVRGSLQTVLYHAGASQDGVMQVTGGARSFPVMFSTGSAHQPSRSAGEGSVFDFFFPSIINPPVAGDGRLADFSGVTPVSRFLPTSPVATPTPTVAPPTTRPPISTTPPVIPAVAGVSATETIIRLPIGSTTPTVNGRTVQIDSPADIIDDRTLVPLRFVTESMGAWLYWDAPSGGITLILDEIMIHMVVGSTTVTITQMVEGGNDIVSADTIDVAPRIINDRTLVPLRFISEAFGADVEWQAETRTAVITHRVYRE